MDKLTFANAQENDIPVITEILSDATEYKVQHGDTSWGHEGWGSEEIQERMKNGNTFFLVKQGDEVVGTVSLGWSDKRNWGERPEDAGYMHQLAIKDGFRGQNLGSQVIDWLADKVTEKDRKFLRLDCDANNAKLCAYYEQQGFTKIGTNSRPDAEVGDYEAALYERPVDDQ